MKLISKITLSDEILQYDIITYVINISLKNGGKYSQILKLVKYHSVWVTASKIESNIYKYSRIDSLFPKKPDGTIDWIMIHTDRKK